MTRLKDKTLKNTYESRTQRSSAVQLLEAADQNTIQQITAALDKLEGLVPDGASILNKALEDAKMELGAYLQGGVKQFFKNLVSDPVAKTTVLANAIRTGLSQLPTVAKLYLPRGADKNEQQSIWELVPQQKRQQLVASFTKVFQPAGNPDVISLFKGNSMPYVQNLEAAVAELLQNTNPVGGFKLASQAGSTPAPEPQKAAASAPKQAGQAAPTPQVAPEPSATAKGAEQTTPTSAPTPTAQTAPTGQTTPTAQPKAATTTKIDMTNKDAIANVVDVLVNGPSRIRLEPKELSRALERLAQLGYLYNPGGGNAVMAGAQKPASKLPPYRMPPKRA